MSGKIFPFRPDHFTKPFFDLGVIDIVVVDPFFIAGVVWRIDVNTLDLSLIAGEQGFQGFKIVAFDNHVLAAVVFGMLPGFIVAVFTIQHPERHFQMMIDDFVFSNPFQCRHQFRPSVFLEELLFVRKGSFFAMSSKSCSS